MDNDTQDEGLDLSDPEQVPLEEQEKIQSDLANSSNDPTEDSAELEED